MDILLELALLGTELLFELVFEVLSDSLLGGLGIYGKEGRRGFWSVLQFGVLGAVMGTASLLILRQPLIHSEMLQWLNLATTPLAAGAVMAFIGRRKRERAMRLVPLESFGAGLTFALAFVVARFVYFQFAR